MAAKEQIFIVFCGVDGSGKTTLAKKICDRFAAEGRSVTYLHGHAYSASKNSFGFNEHGTRALRHLLRVFVPMAFLDNVVTYYGKYRPRLFGRNVISDRYFYDKVARMMAYGICPRWLARVYVSLLPRPDFVFFLDVPPDLATDRKGEYSVERNQEFRDIYRSIAGWVGARVIDTSRPVEGSLDKVARYVER